MIDKKPFFRNLHDPRKLVNDERAVSPVIAEILMVAIVVVLAAVIGAFVFGVGPPTTALNLHCTVISDTTSSVTLIFAGSDRSTKANVRVVIRDLDGNYVNIGTLDGTIDSGTVEVYPDTDDVSGGTVAVITDAANLVSGHELSVVVTDTATGTVLSDAMVRVKD